MDGKDHQTTAFFQIIQQIGCCLDFCGAAGRMAERVGKTERLQLRLIDLLVLLRLVPHVLGIERGAHAWLQHHADTMNACLSCPSTWRTAADTNTMAESPSSRS